MIGNALEKAEVENVIALSVLSQMLVGLAKDMEMSDVDLIRNLINCINIVYHEGEDDVQAISRTTH